MGDRGAATTTGISASVPATLARVEAIGGIARARAFADPLGVASSGLEHDSARFGLSASPAVGFLLNKTMFRHRAERSR